MEATVLRLFRFVPVHIGFDAVLRDTFVPDLLGKPGMVDVFVGRAGPDETGHRLVATFWADVDAMTAAVGRDLDSSPFHPEHLSSTTDHDLRWLPLTFAFPVTDPTEVTILRLVRGRVRPGELDAYIEEARLGTAADMAASRQRDMLPLDHVQRLGAVGGEDDVVSEPLQAAGQHVPIGLGIVDDEQRTRARLHDSGTDCSAA